MTTKQEQLKHWYAITNTQLTESVASVLVVEGLPEPASEHPPLFTNGIPALFCRTIKDPDGLTIVDQLSLFDTLPANIWTMHPDQTILVYFFKPFAAASLFNISARSLSGTPFHLQSWNPQKYTALRTQLLYAREAKEKIEVLDHLLIQQYRENQKVCEIVQYATDQLMNNPDQITLPEILVAKELTERTFQRIFKKYVGVTPTQYRRICQFQLSFGQLRSKKFNKISDVAFDNGFADQSHFIRSFKEFTKITPNDYLKKGLKG